MNQQKLEAAVHLAKHYLMFSCDYPVVPKLFSVSYRIMMYEVDKEPTNSISVDFRTDKVGLEELPSNAAADRACASMYYYRTIPVDHPSNTFGVEIHISAITQYRYSDDERELLKNMGKIVTEQGVTERTYLHCGI